MGVKIRQPLRSATGWLKSAGGLIADVLRRVVGSWSLERKSLLFLGVALVIPIGLSFWFVLQVLAERLVMQTTRQAARDYARAVIAWQHVDGMAGADSVFSNREAMAIMRSHLVDNSEYSKPTFLMLDNEVEYIDLLNAQRPGNAREEGLLKELEEIYREQLQKLEDAERAVVAEGMEQSPDGKPLSSKQVKELVQADETFINVSKSLELLYRDDGPFFPSAAEFDNLSGSAGIRTPSGGWYVYYHAIAFPTSCMQCHGRYQESDAEIIPFRAVRVLIPYAQTQVASTKTLAIMIAVAMVTVTTTLLVVHWVFRRLVLNPLKHLQTVSDEVSHGNTNLRAKIETGDEFNELGDAFNRMLRRMTEDQEELKSLNKELDLRVDQLAQANFNLYEANRLKSDFLANMSHELRTPLNSIIGFSDVLRDISSLSEKQRNYANNIQSSGKVLLDMINEILDLAKLEAGKMNVSPSAFDIKDLIQSQCDVLRPLVDEKNVDIKIDIAEDNLEIFQDRPKLQQILTNLMSNAIKFTPDGGIIMVRAEIINDQYFYFEVEDTGVGIPESDFEIIFEKFRQSNEVLQNGGLTRQYAGTGLGLSIVKELCKLLGGEIQLSSQLGTGSTFRVILPIHFEAGEIQDVSGAAAATGSNT